MRRVRIVIRYYDERGALMLEDEPNLRHYYRVPAHWSRWEIYWDEVLVQVGEREAPPPPPTDRRAVQRR